VGYLRFSTPSADAPCTCSNTQTTSQLRQDRHRHGQGKQLRMIEGAGGGKETHRGALDVEVVDARELHVVARFLASTPNNKRPGSMRRKNNSEAVREKHKSGDRDGPNPHSEQRHQQDCHQQRQEQRTIDGLHKHLDVSGGLS